MKKYMNLFSSEGRNNPYCKLSNRLNSLVVEGFLGKITTKEVHCLVLKNLDNVYQAKNSVEKLILIELNWQQATGDERKNIAYRARRFAVAVEAILIEFQQERMRRQEVRNRARQQAERKSGRFPLTWAEYQRDNGYPKPEDRLRYNGF